MTNDQAPMTNQTAMYNAEWQEWGVWALLFRFRLIGH
jgi:hypothetical protein